MILLRSAAAFLLLAAVLGGPGALSPARTATPAAEASCLGDVNADNRVNSIDLMLIATHFGDLGSPAYDPQYDINSDTRINSIDLMLTATNFGHCAAGGFVVYVSDLLPVGTPINGHGPFERDMSNGEAAAGDGGPITINGAVYAKGLGVHAFSDLRFTVPPNCTMFRADAGIDDEVPSPLGSVTFEAWDGETARLSHTGVRTGADPGTPVEAIVEGVTTLRLVVLAGENDAFDHADWADARFDCEGGDISGPSISGIASASTSTSATITWTTNEIATSQVEYGLTTSYGSTTPLSSMLVTSHGVLVSGLTPNTTYNYRVRSRDAAGNPAVSTNRTFTTAASSGLFGPATPFAAGTNAHSVAMVDVNGDQKLDLITANAGANTMSVLLGNGNGTFAAPAHYATGSQPKSVALGDLNGDGILDAVTSNQATNNVSVLLRNPNGTFQAKTDYAACAGAHESTLADLNGDGRLDIACAGWGASFVGVLLGNGNGTFQPMVSYAAGLAPHSVVAGDFNADSKLDLAVANHNSGSVSVLLGNGNGAFATQVAYTAGAGTHSIRAADLNNDGKLDLVTANGNANTVSVLLGNGNGTFATKVDYATGQTPKGVAIADINGNGVLDILTANIRGNYPTLVNPGGDSVSVLHGNGNGTFQAKTDYTVGQGPFMVAVGDLNGDTKPDIATANWWDNGVTVRLNTLP